MQALQPLPVILLMGPTCSGKTALAVALAQALAGEIISVDSALVYRGMDIGTAKPTLAERGGIRHHLLDCLEPTANFSTGEFRSQALALIADIYARGKLPILAGGTMLYFSALTQGLAQLPGADAGIRERLEQELQALGKQALHDRLAELDPEAAARIHVNDPQRVQRALEVYEISGRSLSSYFQAQPANTLPYRFIKIIVAPEQRAELHEKIAQRFQQMLAQGFLDEVAALHARGDLHPGLPAIRCVGYRQAWAYLDGEYGYVEMQEKAIAATRQLAKRQFTWLRKETDACRLDSAAPDLLAQALAYIQAQLHP
ncbi:tRNA (adenosine(37)-N6)-dimethylallyltransferase MiaA [Methylomonas paludis]|uniref:tRNA dimethylallyltransferase n=1 Tax=Methylomonas paludis TaxID=1173101 RepID=A0A975MR07_9GAMM|nr:tRNA (adenosine(37)-N6)-dimethylallyltransferase MiaA [Methylomonas paludis]QWF72210.1 tRNA (adenosine(37)-N6)-dimethylallyltransferase MiaA [Methylomonas paludis]